MPETLIGSSKRLLDPMERIAEILFGLIMVLSITSSVSITSTGHGDVRTMLMSALGCNLAWGIIDAVFYLLNCVSERGHGLVTLRALRKTTNSGEAQRLIASALPPLLASVLSPAQFEEMRQELNQLPDPPGPLLPPKDDWLAAAGVFLLVFLSTFPVVIPFIFIREAGLALHSSNAIAILMLFLAGSALGRYIGHHPWRVGFVMVLLGGALVGITKALGG